jgi:hypothetical protein
MARNRGFVGSTSSAQRRTDRHTDGRKRRVKAQITRGIDPIPWTADTLKSHILDIRYVELENLHIIVELARQRKDLRRSVITECLRVILGKLNKGAEQNPRKLLLKYKGL